MATSGTGGIMMENDIELTLEQGVELIIKERIYGTAFAIQDKDGNIEIKGLGELENDAQSS